MKTLSTLAIALASASLLVAAHTVQAQGLTREQVDEALHPHRQTVPGASSGGSSGG